ncbi:hypothetical protein BB558_003653 [Smittium angustum]|uniref:DNA-directed RNA polymerase n=1 Tax=Smittium angustum TaxID=133377 RepID=A0A2U1J5J6_SMIAN|nr:hypothetical protein BB558_003653 [Smittium angustum]
MKKLSVFPATSNLPIQLDATCNGIQHLASLIGDLKLAKLVNLMNSKPCEKPVDLYSYSLKLIDDDVKTFISNNPQYSRLTLIKFNRKMVKKSIMTKSYNVTLKGTEQYVLNMFRKEFDKEQNIMYFKPLKSKDPDIKFTIQQIGLLTKIIYNVLYTIHPELKLLVDYLAAMAKILNKLNQPIV